MLQQFYPQPKAHDFKYELNKDMHFAAAHFVPHESAGKCQDTHGHTYFVNITVAGNKLNDAGFLVNFQDIKKAVHNRYDHTLLNDHPDFDSANGFGVMPTTETVAEQIHENVQDILNVARNGVQCLQVIVRETPSSYVIFRPAAGGLVSFPTKEVTE